MAIGLVACFLIVSAVPVFTAAGDELDGSNSDLEFGLQSKDLELGGEVVFIENIGQWDEGIGFLAQTSFGHVAFSNEGIYYDLIERIDGKDAMAPGSDHSDRTMRRNVMKISFLDSNDVNPEGTERVETLYNFFIGNDPSRWASGARGFRSVIYQDVWDGINIQYYQKDGSLKYDIIVNPGADPEGIVFDVEGAESLSTRSSELIISTKGSFDILDSGLDIFYG